jgi:glycosyltransferase involved in cell wall biosynthesis
MPVWNASAFIRQTLESVAAQTYPNLQVLISDDASDDDTAAICEHFAAGDARFRVHRQQVRRGWVGNANFLLDQARGDYLFFAFHDDPLRPRYVERLVDALDSHPAAVLAFSDIVSRGRVERYIELEGLTDRLQRSRRVIRKRGLWWIPNRGLFRAEAARRIGGMRRHLAGEYKADWPWLLHLALLGEFVRVPEPLIEKVWSESTLSAQWKRRLTLWRSTAVTLACAREIRRVAPPLAEEVRMHRELAKFWLRTVLRGRRL